MRPPLAQPGALTASPSELDLSWSGLGTALQGREFVASLGAILVFWLAAALVWPLTGSVVPWDSKNHFYPMLRHLGDALAEGELPLWNPYHFGGHPAVADPQSLLFSPTMVLFAWLMPKASMAAFDLAVFAHLLPGAFAFPFLFRRRGWHLVGSIVAAMIFLLGGSAAARLQHTGIILGYGLYPLAFLLLEDALERASFARAAVFAAVASLMVIGRDQVAFLSALSLIALVAHMAVRSGAPLAYLRDRLPHLALMGAIGVALLAVPVLLTLQLVGTSTRPSFAFDVAAMGSLPPQSLATILFGNVFGSLRWSYDYWGPDWTSLGGRTSTDRATNYLFAGTLPALLLVWHGIAGRRLLAPESRFFLLLGLAALVYAVGHTTPLFALAFDHLPGIRLYRRPADATFLINIALAFTGGYLVHRFIRDGLPVLSEMGGRAPAAFSLGVAIALVAAAVASALSFAMPAGMTGPAIREIVLTLVAAACAVTLMRRWSGTSSGRLALAAILVTSSGAELISRHAAASLNAEPASRYGVFDTLPREEARGLAILRSELAERRAKGERPRVEILGLAGGWQNASMVLGLENTLGYNPLRIAGYAEAVGPGENAVDPHLRGFPATFGGYESRLARRIGLEYLVLDRPIERLPANVPPLSGATILHRSPSMWIYRLSPAEPRVSLVASGSRRADSVFMGDTAGLLRASFGAYDGSPHAQGSAAITRYRRNAVSLAVQTDRDSVVVLHDIHYPGWEAYVDGKPAPIMRTELLFRGVEVGPGRHQVEFVYRPFSATNLASALAGLRVSGMGAGE